MMSGTASRYIGGVPYGPGMGVGRYPNAASITGGSTIGYGGSGSIARPVDASGIIMPPMGDVAGGVSAPGVDVGNLLLQAALNVAPYAEDIYNLARDQFGGADGANVAAGALDAGTFAGPGGVAIPRAALGGFGTNWNNVFEPGWEVVDDAASIDGLLAPVGDAVAPAAPSVPAGSGGLLDLGAGYDFGLTGALGELPMVGDLALAGADLLGGYLGNLASAPAVNRYNPNSQYGQQIGTTIGGILGSFIPVPVLGTFVGATAGGALGAAAGDQMGARPTVGPNFSALGSFGQGGDIAWTGMGGDNGGGAADAAGVAGTFENDLLALAAAQGLRFNPAMAGAQIRVGGYDNPTRGGIAPGGFFYTPDAGASPENYALRPNAGMDAYSPQQQATFTQAVLADLAARDVFTPTGQGRGLDYFGASVGAPLGFYGYNTIGNGGYSGLDSFGETLGQRQSDILGWINGAAERQADAAAGDAWRESVNAAQIGADGAPIFAQISAPVQFDGGA